MIVTPLLLLVELGDDSPHPILRVSSVSQDLVFHMSFSMAYRSLVDNSW